MKSYSLQSLALALQMIATFAMPSSNETAIGSTTTWIDKYLCSWIDRNFPKRFLLYKSEHEGPWVGTIHDDKDFLDHLDPKKEIVFALPEFLNGCLDETVTEIKERYLKLKRGIQVVAVCWDEAFPGLKKRISHLAWFLFPISYGAVTCAGKSIAAFLEHLNRDHGVPLEKMSMVSHSLGCQVAGAAGNVINGKVGRVIALDPCRSAAQFTEGHLNKHSAVHVMVLHTSITMGIWNQVGTVDFYANRGFGQPGCITPSCSHYRSAYLFLESLEKEGAFEATKCDSYKLYVSGQCDQNPKTNFTYDTKASGVYFFLTGSKYPFSVLEK